MCEGRGPQEPAGSKTTPKSPKTTHGDFSVVRGRGDSLLGALGSLLVSPDPTAGLGGTQFFAGLHPRFRTQKRPRVCGERRASAGLVGSKTTPGRHQRGGRGEIHYWSPLTSTTGLGTTRRPYASFPFSTPYRTSTSLNLTHLNSTQLNSFLDPPRPPFWSLLATQIGPRSA